MPPVVDLGERAWGTSSTFRVPTDDLDMLDAKVIGLDYDDRYFELASDSIGPMRDEGGLHQMIRLLADAPVGSFVQHLDVITDSSSVPLVRVELTGEIVASVVSEPQFIELVLSGGGNRAEAELILRRTDGKPLPRVDVENPMADRIACEAIPSDEPYAQKFLLRSLLPPSAPAFVSGDLVFKTRVEDGVFEIPVKVYVRSSIR